MDVVPFPIGKFLHADEVYRFKILLIRMRDEELFSILLFRPHLPGVCVSDRNFGDKRGGLLREFLAHLVDLSHDYWRLRAGALVCCHWRTLYGLSVEIFVSDGDANDEVFGD